jgi:segregation and condensation protein A
LTSPVQSRGRLPASWRVQLPVFEGPLDLLLRLVRVNEVEIAEIPVATVCDQFREYLQLMEELNLDVAAEYIFEAAQLIHLKSRLLLPRRQEGEGAAEDPRQELVERLLEYRRIKEAAQSLAEIDGIRHGVWTRPPEPLPVPEGETIDLGEVSLFDLLGAFREVVGRYEREHPGPLHVQREDFHVRDQLERLLGLLGLDRPYDLLEDLRGRSCRAEVVAAFLAVLELARLNLVRFHQTAAREILLYRTDREIQRHELEAIQG